MNFALYPIAFYVALVLLAVSIAYAATGMRQGWGLPAIVVLLTVGGWYFGDALYNNYEEYFWEFGRDTLSNAWWQVGAFILGFVVMVKPVCDWMNLKLLNEESFAMRMYEKRLRDEEVVQHQIDQAASGLLLLWVVLTVIGLFRVDWDVAAVFAPFWAGYVANPWGRGQIGGTFDAVLSLTGYVQAFLAATFGVIWAVSKNPRTRWLAGFAFLLAAPMYLFDRTRNAMLAVVVPGALAWGLLRLRTSWFLRAVVLIGMFLALNFWMLFVMSKRGETTIAQAVQQEDAFASVEQAKHEGLNMFSELAWINHFIKLGVYEPNWGHRYFAEVANIIPRALWPGKPKIGLDYSVLRGQLADDVTGMVTATVSTGMIGQGVVNFGQILGPIFAALLMALWVGLLARQDLMAEKNPARFLLYATGIILTFNMGRDITPLVCYPFFFGYALISYFEKKRGSKATGGRIPEIRGQRSEDGGRRSKYGDQRSEVRGRRTEDGAPVEGDDEGTKRPEVGGRRFGTSVVRETGVSVREGEAGAETADERRDVGTGGTVRTLPAPTPKRIARWMPRRVRAAVVAAQSAVEEGAGAKPQIGVQTPETNGQSSEVKQRPRQLGVPFQNYRRYRG